jgi:hypothetical protein
LSRKSGANDKSAAERRLMAAAGRSRGRQA